MPVILIISGPAGSGKTTLCDQLVDEFDAVSRFVTTTSRAPRPNEEQGIDYHFMTPEAFRKGIDEGAFIEWAYVHGRYYGSGKADVQRDLAAGKDLIFNIDVQGAAALVKELPALLTPETQMKTLFIQPSSLEQLKERLEKRGTDGPDEIERRMQSARKEIETAHTFDLQIQSGSRESDYATFRKVYLELKESPPLRK